MQSGKTHRTAEGESLGDIAHRYRLNSWRAIAHAPGNEHIAHHDRNAPLAAATPVVVPPPAFDLLRERIHSLHRVRPLLQRQFAEHQERVAGDLRRNLPQADLTDARSVAELLQGLDDAVQDDIRSAELQCADFVRINAGLAATHVYKEPDIVAYAGYRNPAAGICWLLEKSLADQWLDIWSPAFWIERWHGCAAAEAVMRAELHFGSIRSRVMQQVDRRLRETHSVITRLREE